MEKAETCKLDLERFRNAVVEKLSVMVGSAVEDTGYHLKPAGGRSDYGEVELTFRKNGKGYSALVDGKQVRHVYVENDANAWTVAGEVMARLAAQKQQRERLRREQAETEQCLLLLKDFSLPEDSKCRCNVHGGRAHLEIRASFRPERIRAFIDMVEMARLTLEDGDEASPAENDGETSKEDRIET